MYQANRTGYASRQLPQGVQACLEEVVRSDKAASFQG